MYISAYVDHRIVRDYVDTKAKTIYASYAYWSDYEGVPKIVLATEAKEHEEHEIDKDFFMEMLNENLKDFGVIK